MTQRSAPAGIDTVSSRNGRRADESKPVSADLTELVTRAIEGERTAFDELVRATHGDAYGLAIRLTGNQEDAQDVVQEAYLRAYRGMGSFRGDAKFSTWLYRIVANTASTHTTRRRRHRHEPLDATTGEVHADDYYLPEAQAEGSDLRDRVKSAIGELPPRLRSVMVLRDMYDMPHDAIAQELGISVSATKVRLHRARQRLRERVFVTREDDGDESRTL